MKGAFKGVTPFIIYYYFIMGLHDCMSKSTRENVIQVRFFFCDIPFADNRLHKNYKRWHRNSNG